MSEMVYPRSIADGMGVGSDARRLACWIDDMSFFRIIFKTGLDTALAFVALCREQEVDWSCVDLEDLFFCISGVQKTGSCRQTNACTNVGGKKTVNSSVTNVGLRLMQLFLGMMYG